MTIGKILVQWQGGGGFWDSESREPQYKNADELGRVDRLTETRQHLRSTSSTSLIVRLGLHVSQPSIIVIIHRCSSLQLDQANYWASDPSLAQLIADNVDNLFRKMLYKEHHVLKQLLPEKRRFNHQHHLRQRHHNFCLTVKTDDRNFVMFKNLYWQYIYIFL